MRIVKHVTITCVLPTETATAGDGSVEPDQNGGEKAEGGSESVSEKTAGAEEVKIEEPQDKDQEEEEEEFDSEDDDPERLWCICQQPHDDRYASSL